MGEARRTIAAAFVTIFLAVLSLAPPGSAGGEELRPSCFCNELARNAPEWRLFLCAKDPATWRVLPAGGWGELTIHRPSGRFAFRGHGLRPATEYALIRHAGQSSNCNVLACGWADERGEFRAAGVWPAWSGKFWLVLGSDLQGRCADLLLERPATIKGWHPADYLFETETL